MKKKLIILGLVTSFGFGFAFSSILAKTNRQQVPIKRVTGIGGIFFKCKEPAKFKQWYKTHLGIEANAYGARFNWREEADSTQKGYTLWTPFSEKTKYFEPTTQNFMINYRVENIEALVEELKKEGVTILDKIESYDYGKFVHIMDVEGNKVELFEPTVKG